WKGNMHGMNERKTRLAEILKAHEDDLSAQWIKDLKSAGSGKENRISETELSGQVKDFINLRVPVAELGDVSQTHRAEWAAISEFLEAISLSRVLQGFTSDETATFIFSFKSPLFARLRTELGRNADAFADDIGLAT